MIVQEKDYLAHSGVLGMKWGHRKQIFNNNSYSTIKKGATLTRISLTKNESVGSDRKYVSTNKRDQKFWEEYLVDYHKSNGREFVYKYKYKTIKDLKISTDIENGREFANKLLSDPNFKKKVIDSNNDFLRRTDSTSKDLTTDFFESLAWRGLAANDYMTYMENKGYDAISDTFGKRTGAKNPIILLNPSEAIKLKRISEL